MAGLERVSFFLESGPFAGLVVRVDEVTLYEALREPYGAEVRVLVLDPDFDAATVLGKDAVLILERGSSLRRRVAGIIREVREGGRNVDDDSDGVRLDLVIVPALWMLSRRRDTRIFQDMTVPEILTEVLDGALEPYGRAIQSELAATYPRCEYRVQYQESDLDFVHRLMGEEGIFYDFDHEGEVEALILKDSNDACDEVEDPPGGLVAYQANNLVIREAEPVRMVHRAHRNTTTSVVVGDWDWTRATMPFSEEQRAGDSLDRDRESYEHGRGRSLTINEYAGTGYGAADGARQAQIRHEGHTRDALTIEGVGVVVGFKPGTTFELTGHPTLGMDGEYLIVRVIHQNSAPGTLLGAGDSGSDPYHNRFECVPLATPYRPSRENRKPRVTGIQTAVVTGPAGEEIHVDEHGRIKVQFHWDRVGANDEHTTCWIRVEQAWAGAGWGFWYVPRIGMEVVVQFVDGDPDRPLVTGCVYNATNLTPYALPDEKTKSTMKSNSSLGGGGFNEFRFEDLAGSEEIYTHAQKDYNEVVENDHNTLVHHDQKNEVDNDQTQTVHNDQFEQIDVDQTMTVDGNRTVHVKSNFDETVDGTETRHVVGDVSETFDANETRTILGNVTEDISGSETRTVSGNQGESITGSHSQTTSGSSVATVAGAMSKTVTGGITETTPASYNITAVGGYTVTAAGGIQMMAPGGVTLLAPGGVSWVDNAIQWVGGDNFMFTPFGSSVFLSKVEAVGVAIGVVGMNLEACSFEVANTVTKNANHMAKIRAMGTRISGAGVRLRNWAFGNEGV